MQLVVKISEEDYKILININDSSLPSIIARMNFYKALKNGTPLPKGHGNLVDTNELIENGVATESYLNTFIKTIIEADKEIEE